MEAKHESLCMDLEIYSASSIKNNLKVWLGKILADPQCPICGGLLPELSFQYNGRTYDFVCWKITDKKGEVLRETNYRKLATYLQAQEGSR